MKSEYSGGCSITYIYIFERYSFSYTMYTSNFFIRAPVLLMGWIHQSTILETLDITTVTSILELSGLKMVVVKTYHAFSMILTH